MATTVKITTIGNSVGIVLPKEILNHLHVEKGDSLYITESPDGIQLSPYDVRLRAGNWTPQSKSCVKTAMFSRSSPKVMNEPTLGR